MRKAAKKRGRPTIDTEPITVRLPREVIEAIERARRAMDVPPTRPQIVRTALIDWLKARGYFSR